MAADGGRSRFPPSRFPPVTSPTISRSEWSGSPLSPEKGVASVSVRDFAARCRAGALARAGFVGGPIDRTTALGDPRCAELPGAVRCCVRLAVGRTRMDSGQCAASDPRIGCTVRSGKADGANGRGGRCHRDRYRAFHLYSEFPSSVGGAEGDTSKADQR